MILWIILGSAIFYMILLYLIIGPHKVFITSIIYGVSAIITGVLLYLLIDGLYALDLFALLIPYIILLPLHIGTKYFIKSYVIKDDKTSSYKMKAIYNRLNNILWIVEGFLLLSLALALIDAIYDGFEGLIISTISILGGIIIGILFILIFLGYKKKFNYVVIVGNDKNIYKFKTNKRVLLTTKYLGQEVKVYPRGIYFENGEIMYLYYIKENMKVIETYFKPYKSELFSYLKKHLDDSHELELAYNNFIEEKTR